MASARLSSSRNCENSGANLIVSFCALRSDHHLPMAVESDHSDMTERTNQRNFPNAGVFSQISAMSRFITSALRGVGGWVERPACLLGDGEREWLLYELLHFLAA